MKRIAFVLVALGMVAFVSVIAFREPQARGEDDTKAAIKAVYETYTKAFHARDAAGVAACYTADAELFPEGMDVVKGNAAVQAYWESAMQSDVVQSINVTPEEIEQHDDTAIEIGRATVADGQGKTLDTAKYIVIWKRIDGKWKLHRDISNSNTAPGTR